jgi:predicted RNase H-like HicB family nuclease
MSCRTDLDVEITANIRQEDGSYWAEVPALPGCFAAGATLDELVDSLREGVELYLAGEEDLPPEGQLHLTSAVLSDASA